MSAKLTHIPTNLIMGFLGAGKTTAILDLLKQKPKHENWAVLVNEFGKVGIDGAIFAAAGATVKEIAGGCLCCAVSVPFQTSINRLLNESRPDRLLIEPSGLGHPKKVLAMLSTGGFKNVLDLRAAICLVDPEKFKDSRYTTHENFIDQIALADVLVANKTDLADQEAIELFQQWAEQSSPSKNLITHTEQGQLDINWLDIARNPQRHAVFPNAHKITPINSAHKAENQLNNAADGYQSFGFVFPENNCFDYSKMMSLFNQLGNARIKGLMATDQGWFIINCVDGYLHIVPTSASAKSRIEIITRHDQLPDISTALDHCRIDT